MFVTSSAATRSAYVAAFLSEDRYTRLLWYTQGEVKWCKWLNRIYQEDCRKAALMRLRRIQDYVIKQRKVMRRLRPFVQFLASVPPQIMQGTMPGARRRGRPRTAWMDNVKTWTGLSVESQSE